jgi:hypothetical protein
MSIKRLARGRRGLHQAPLAHVQRRLAQQVQRAQHAVHRRADLVAHRRQELALGDVGRLGRLLRPQQRGVRLVGFEAVAHGPQRNVAELARGLVHGDPEHHRQHGQRQRADILREQRHAHQRTELQPASSRKHRPAIDMKKAAVATEPQTMTT